MDYPLHDCRINFFSPHIDDLTATSQNLDPFTIYFNFIASHDGIGLRPVEGLLEQAEVEELLGTMEQFGGRVSWRQAAGSEAKPYEINIALRDALQVFASKALPITWNGLMLSALVIALAVPFTVELTNLSPLFT